MGKLLAIDYGDRNLGFAISDESLTIAFPRESKKITNYNDALIIIQDYLLSENINKLIIGLPLTLDNKSSVQTKKTQEFIDYLSQNTELPIDTFDERYTSKQAKGIIKQNQKMFSKDDEHSLAAQIMLQTYLNSL